MRSITVGDGKYTFVRNESGLLVDVLRHGVSWSMELTHSNVTHALLDRIEELEAELARVTHKPTARWTTSGDPHDARIILEFSCSCNGWCDVLKAYRESVLRAIPTVA